LLLARREPPCGPVGPGGKSDFQPAADQSGRQNCEQNYGKKAFIVHPVAIEQLQNAVTFYVRDNMAATKRLNF